MSKVVGFFKESVYEMRKVVWPSKDTVLSSTKVVVVTMLIMAFLLGGTDFLMDQLLYFIMGLK